MATTLPRDPAHNSRIDKDTAAIDGLSRVVSAAASAPLFAIQSITQDGIVQIWNDSCESLYGIAAREAIGKPLDHLLQRLDQQAEFAATLARIWQTGQPVLPRDWHVQAASGNTRQVYSILFPVFQEATAHQIFCMDIDISARSHAEQALLDIGANFRTLFTHSGDATMLREDEQLIDVNPATLALFGYPSKTDMVGHTSATMSPPQQPDGMASAEKSHAMQELVRQKGNHRYDWLYVNSRGEPFWTEEYCTDIQVGNQRLQLIVVRDISSRKSAEVSLHLAKQVIENSQEGIIIADQHRRIVSINKALTDITGYTAEEVIGNPPQILCAETHDKTLFHTISVSVHKHDHWQGELWGRHRDGRGYPLWLEVNTVRDNHHAVINYIGIITDLSERKASEDQLRHLTEHDALTGLPNRVLLLDRLQQAIAVAERNRTQLALLCLDLDRFKNINDAFGHSIGDRLLRTVAQRLKKCVKTIDTVSHLGGDEFVILLVDTGNGKPIMPIAEAILQAIGMPYSIEGCDFTITTCIGVSTYPADGINRDVLIKQADIAMHHAKGMDNNRIQFFNDDMNARIVLENSLRNALRSHEFILEYQPQIHIASNQLIGAEALIRWQHPALGRMMPARFIRVAEECGLIVPIGDWALRQACLQARAWQDQGLELVIAVNLSVAQFHQKNLLRSVTEALQEARLAPRYLQLEITESIMMDEAKGAIDMLRALRDLGIRLAIDDFGTGFSSLSYLKRIPIDKLKIDQSFVRDITLDPEDAGIINAIIVMAKSLNLTVIAEGVETLEQFHFLEAHGCDEYQGFLASKVLSVNEFSARYLPSRSA
ncbi:MAG: diguanylate cyclase (GGDEF)-like protein/PAS domain S-box-containing protein [Burkholderiaceae bacterium]|jgi:diguanylate cyclase (GGDEF)-like protein/PAS domain S-box-containing protein